MYIINITSTDLEKNFIKEKTIVILPLSTIEQHGPHLPYGTKGFIVEAIAAECTRYLKKDEIQTLILPTLYFAPCHISDGFSNNFNVSARTFSDFIYEIGYSIYLSGFRYLCILNLLISPDTLKAIQIAIEDLNKLDGMIAFDPMSLWVFSNYEGFDTLLKQLNIDPRSEIHGDIKETSALLYLDPILVKKELLSNLKPCTPNLSWELMKGNYTYKEMGSQSGYIGTPSKANEELGKKYIEKAAEILAESIKYVVDGNSLPSLPLSIRMIIKLIDIDEI